MNANILGDIDNEYHSRFETHFHQIINNIIKNQFFLKSLQKR